MATKAAARKHSALSKTKRAGAGGPKGVTTKTKTARKTKSSSARGKKR